jgi:hypothetical protein
MKGTVGRRVWRALPAALATLLLVLTPAGNADNSASGQGRSDVQAVVAHASDVMAIPSSTRAAAGRTTSSTTDAALTPEESAVGPRSLCRIAPQAERLCHVDRSPVTARAPPLKG